MKTLELAILRSKQMNLGLTCTTGELIYVEGERHICYTLEDEVREIPGQAVSTWKVDKQTAIPMGRYLVTLENSKRFGPETLTLNNVPGFVAIRMHGGNDEDDTEGCPLLGDVLDPLNGRISGGTARGVVNKVKDIVRKAQAQGLQVWLTVAWA